MFTLFDRIYELVAQMDTALLHKAALCIASRDKKGLQTYGLWLLGQWTQAVARDQCDPSQFGVPFDPLSALRR